MTRLGLSINEAKTSLKDARADGFDFLGYTFGPGMASTASAYLGARPSAKSLKRIKGKISDLLRPGEHGRVAASARAAEPPAWRMVGATSATEP